MNKRNLVLFKQKPENKLTPTFETEPYSYSRKVCFRAAQVMK